jgi:Tfp pilus assembly protein PilN
MKAVNLIPSEERRSSGRGGASGGAAYVLLGALALLVVMAGAYAVAGKNLNDKRAELTKVTREAEAAEAKAKALDSYTRFSQLRESRVQTVTSLAGSRFDWSHALREVSRVVPSAAWLTNLVGTIAPGVQVNGASSGSSQIRGARQSPAIEVTGCTTNQKNITRILTRMRLIDGVETVTLASSEKSDSGGGGASSGAQSGGSSDCRNGSDEYPQFNLVVFFKAPAVAAPAPGTAAGGATPSASPTPAASSSSQPASGGNTP